MRLCDWARATWRRYHGRVWIRIIDNQSLGGWWRMLRYRFRRTPTFIFEGQAFVGWEAEPQLHAAIERRLSLEQASPQMPAASS